jgi:hypothetical protein
MEFRGALRGRFVLTLALWWWWLAPFARPHGLPEARADVLPFVQGGPPLGELITPPHVEASAELGARTRAEVEAALRPLALKLGRMLLSSCQTLVCQFDDRSLPALAEMMPCDAAKPTCLGSIAHYRGVDVITHGALKRGARLTLVLRRYHLGQPARAREVEELVPDERSDVLLSEWTAHLMRRLESEREGILVVRLVGVAAPAAVRLHLRNLETHEQREGAPGAVLYLREGTYELALEAGGHQLSQGTISVLDGQRIELGVSSPELAGPPSPALPIAAPLRGAPAAPPYLRPLEVGGSVGSLVTRDDRGTDLAMTTRVWRGGTAFVGSFVMAVAPGGLRTDTALGLGCAVALPAALRLTTTVGGGYASRPHGRQLLLFPVEAHLEAPGRVLPVLHARVSFDGLAPGASRLAPESVEVGLEVRLAFLVERRATQSAGLRLAYRNSATCESAACPRAAREHVLLVGASYVFGYSW